MITSLNENQKNIEFLQKNIEVGEHKIKLLSQLNSQLNQFFKSKNENQTQIQSQNQPKNSITNNNKDNVLEILNLVKSLNIVCLCIIGLTIFLNIIMFCSLKKIQQNLVNEYKNKLVAPAFFIYILFNNYYF